MKVTQMPPVHAANLVANSGNIAYGVDVITCPCSNIGYFLMIKGPQIVNWLHHFISELEQESHRYFKSYILCRLFINMP